MLVSIPNRISADESFQWHSFTGMARSHDRDHKPVVVVIWEGHRAGMEIGYCHIEKLTNLDQLPANGFQIACFPWKIKKASAGFTRAVAIFDD